MTIQYRAGIVTLAVVLALGGKVYATETLNAEDNKERQVSVGSHLVPNTAINSSVPTNSIRVPNELDNSLNVILPASNPSFIFPTPNSSDSLSLIQPFYLRGLSSDKSLVLINGKRRHRSSVIAFDNAGINDGAQGPDISTIPAVALKKVEVLHSDGSAVYGSDAVAGVVNFVLKDSDEGGSLSVSGGEYFEGDGTQTTVDGNIGIGFFDTGFINLSFQSKQADATRRTVQRPDAENLAEQGNIFISDPAQIWGNPETEEDHILFFNSAVDLDEDKEIYAFGNFANRDTLGSLAYRNPQNSNGIFTIDSGENLLVGDRAQASDEDQERTCPSVAIPKNEDSSDGNVLTSPSYLEMLGDSNCFSINSLYPGGFSPTLASTVTDGSATFGSRGSLDNGFIEFLDGFNYDISGSIGKSKTDYTLSNTLNPSLGLESPTSFIVGSHVQKETTVNADLSNQLDIGLTEKMNFVTGIEWRKESFKIITGDESAWQDGIYKEQGFSAGSVGITGFNVDTQGTTDRNSLAGFVEVESIIADDIILGAALRYENFSTFGDVISYQLTGQYILTETISFRASHGIGYSAPTVAQESMVNTQSSEESDGLIEYTNYPAIEAVSTYKGAIALEPEESENTSFGAVYNLDALTISIDGYLYSLSDRIVRSPIQHINEDEWPAMIEAGIETPEDFTDITFFANDYETKTKGIDFNIDYAVPFLAGDTFLNAAYSWHETSVEDAGMYTDEFTVQRIEEGLPQSRATFSVLQQWHSFSLLIRANYFGQYLAVHNDMESFSEEADPATLVDIELSYRLNDSFTFLLGAKNVFDQEAMEIKAEEGTGNQFGGVYYETSPFDYNGGFYYIKAQYNF